MDLLEAEGREFAAGPRHPWERARLALAAKLIGRDVPVLAGSTVLDIGCGDTFVAEQIGARHPAARVVAVDTAFTDALIQLYGRRLSVPNVRLFRSLDAVSPGGPVSLILLMDVIEHVPDDRAFLQDILGRSWCDASTRVLITVPSYQWLFGAHDRALGHYRRYTKRTLRELVSSVGLSPVVDGHFFSSLVPVRAVQILSERLTGSHDPPPDLGAWSGGELAGRALTTWLTVDGFIGITLSRYGLGLPGLSNFALCRMSA